MPPPGILQGFGQDVDLSVLWKLVAITETARLQDFEKKHKANPTMSFKHVPLSFGRLIAKIGYGHILTQLDMDDFEPIVLPLILGAHSNASYFVGSTAENSEPDVGLGYKLSTAMEGTIEQAYILAQVRLLANNFTPTYSVVVGRTNSAKGTLAIIEKLGPGQISTHLTPI